MDQSLKTAIETARRMNAVAATIKDWRLNRKIDRAMKAAAQQVNRNGAPGHSGCGYIIATPWHLKEIYPEFVTWALGGPDDNLPIVWAFHAGLHDRHGRCRISLCPVYVPGHSNA
jgi:hypothetical protein